MIRVLRSSAKFLVDMPERNRKCPNHDVTTEASSTDNDSINMLLSPNTEVIEMNSLVSNRSIIS